MTGLQQWEYLTVVWTYSAEQRTRALESSGVEAWAAEAASEETYWHFWETFYIWRPGAEKAETRDGWASDKKEKPLSTTQVLNDLGAEGWELVSEETDRSYVSRSQSSPIQGWGGSPISNPIRKRWTFKRQARQ